jgi:hypothetical protein
MRRIWLVVVLAAACSGSDKAPATPTGAGGGGGSGNPSAPAGGPMPAECASARGKVEALYRAEAQQKEPKRVDQAVADNTAMALADCAREPGKRAPCMAGAATVAQLERDCLIPLDPEGTEGEASR